MDYQGQKGINRRQFLELGVKTLEALAFASLPACMKQVEGVTPGSKIGKITERDSPYEAEVMRIFGENYFHQVLPGTSASAFYRAKNAIEVVEYDEDGRGRVKYETGEMNISKEKGLHVLMPYKVEGQLVTWLELDQRIKFADPRIVSEQENLAIGRRTHKDAPRGYEFLKLQGKPYLMVKVEHEKETKFSKSDSLYLPFYAIPLEGLKTRTHQRSGRLILMHDKGLLIPTFITESEINSLIKEKSPKKDISGPQATGVGN